MARPAGGGRLTCESCRSAWGVNSSCGRHSGRGGGPVDRPLEPNPLCWVGYGERSLRNSSKPLPFRLLTAAPSTRAPLLFRIRAGKRLLRCRGAAGARQTLP